MLVPNMAEYDKQIFEAGIFKEEGVETIQRLWEKEAHPDAIFCFNDPVAMGVYTFLKQNGIRIPQDVGVVGFTESQFADQISPPLTSVEQPTMNIGRTAAQCMLDAIRYGEQYSPRTIMMDGELHIRESSGRGE